MMRTRLFTSLYAGLIVYLASLFFFGSTGWFAQSDLERRRDSLAGNISELEKQGKNLAYVMSALQSDPDRILREAVRLMLVRENEGIVRVAGYTEKPRPVSPGGLVLRRDSPPRGTEPLLRAVAAAAGVIVFLFYGLAGKRGGNQGTLSQTSS